MDSGGYGVFMQRAIPSIMMALVLQLCITGQGLASPVQDEGDAPRQPRIINQQGLIRPGNIPQLKNRNQMFRRSLDSFLDIEMLKRAKIPTEVLDLVDQLASDEFTEREAASSALRKIGLSDEILMAVLEQRPLGYEQQNRLLRVIQWRVRERRRGAVGIRMRMAQSGVVITELVAGLPAEQVLEVGDEIVMINGEVVRSNDDLVKVVQALLPETIIKMKVLRPQKQKPGELLNKGLQRKEEIEVEFPLGDFEKLESDSSATGLTNPETERRKNLVAAIQDRYEPTPARIEGSLPSDAGGRKILK